ncbi:MAG TPA: single-stranded-DNA-specific exonuclease RecJ [Bacillota bacterium]|nr:single-stranded-DNA-specific exonuclease RecJ [Bacillota bacterium]
MIKSKYIWHKQVEGIVDDQQIFKTLLMNRNISDYETFFSMGKERLIDPFKLSDMKISVERIKQAIINKEKIIIFGDYDCDGISSIAVLYRSLMKLNAQVDYDLPDRFNEGYGLNERAVSDIIESGYKLVITVDNGITCVNEIKQLQDQGIDCIITDHHQPSEETPEAFAIIHPKLSPDYPFKEIAGVMVAYKLASALLDDTLDDLLDLVMIGTIADLMPLENENQAMVNLGIERIRNTSNIGLKKLLDYSNLDIINVTAIAFKIAPKINSSGRLNKAKEAVELLITEDIKRANDLIIDIEKNHDLRKKLTEDAFLICEELVDPNDSVLVVASKDLHEGVIGICAQRLVEKYQKSTIVLNIDNDNLAKGSARSFGDANILEMLNMSADLLEKYGGHSQAAGLQLYTDNLDSFKKRLNSLEIEETNPVLKVDMEVYLPRVSVKTIKDIQDKSFFTATYIMSNLRIARKQILNFKHTKLQLEVDGYYFDALDFNSLEYYYLLNPGDFVKICGGLNVNSYRNRDSLQIMIKDISTDMLQVLDFRKSKDDSISYLREETLHLNDNSIIKNHDWITDLKRYKTVALLPREKALSINPLIDRSELGKIYQYFEKLDHFQKEDLNYFNYDEFIYENALKIFVELGLIDNINEKYQVLRVSKKMDLNNSKTFKQMNDNFHFINFIYQNDLQTIKQYFNQILEEKR